MSQVIKILMVDDHPIIIEGYQNTLMATKNEDQTLIIDTANDCDTANLLMQKSAQDVPYDVLFFDIRLPGSKDGKITSGEDLGVIAKKILPNAKIIILTMFNESYRIHNIIKNVDPDGFLIKSDLTSSELAEAFQHILVSPPYYSSTVSIFLNKLVTSDIHIDDINRKILHLLSQGIKTKSLTEYIDLSMSSIEKRKKQMKLLFSIEDGKDETLIFEARKKGFL
ncbi:DNA-binding response regulator [Aquaticitalea lipolytica]|jgi:DNA-binding NarL/FixJ family response regulator|uniref:DNA-binding response regulator n=1 Tax=Aquaticitalea lipolytica TaxID=1247562 RepID=A0A8J2TP24_9FLAO|nr:response regulator [Aquaticitalea lipolytica]GFZ81961.1 DNA-binding response regulator [Aquaticitalea lipolytica]